VDDGKSTLIGRLLYDSKSLMEDQLEALERSADLTGGGQINLANLTDGLRAEREQGITIDVAYRYFATPRRKFIIADTPGHVQYTRNMVTGASTANLSIVLVDARAGVIEQSRRHTCHRVAAAHPAPRRRRQQDGPRRLERGPLPRNPRAVRGVPAAPRHART
jgi:sulfate adenylyltransferase subunit 1